MTSRMAYIVVAVLSVFLEIGECHAASPESPCFYEVSSREERARFMALRKRGYSESVSRRIAVSRPDLGEFVQSRSGVFSPPLVGDFQRRLGEIPQNKRPSAKKQRDPVTVYRGICADASTYNPRFNEFHSGYAEPSSMFVASDRAIAQSYARTCADFGKSALLLEFQMPGALMLSTKGELVLGDKVWVVRRDHAPDDFAFLASVEILSVGQPPRTVDFEAFCQWRQELRKNGEAMSGKLPGAPQAKGEAGR